MLKKILNIFSKKNKNPRGKDNLKLDQVVDNAMNKRKANIEEGDERNKLFNKIMEEARSELKSKIIILNEKIIRNKKKVVYLTNAPRPCIIVKQYLLKLGMKENLLKNIMSSGEASMEALKKERFGKFFFHLGPNKDNEIFVDIKNNKL